MKTRVCLAELGVPYANHPVDLIETGAYENIRPAFLAVNPGGTVPVLVHRGHPVYESHEQIRYAADHAPPGSPKLVPDDDALRAEMQRWIDRSSLTHDPIEHGDESAGNAVPGQTLPLFAAMIDRIPYWKILEGLLFHFDKRRPLVFVLFKLRGLEKLGTLGPAMKILARSRRQMHAHLDALAAQLHTSGGPWILGPNFSLADVSWLVIFQRLVQVDCLHPFVGEGRRPECAAYWHRLTQRPSYRQAILEHSHPTIAYGTERLQKAKAKDPALREALEGPAAG
jgi:glutathione S-transferase